MINFKTNSIILSAGRGKRMRYKTTYIAKPLIKIQNKSSKKFKSVQQVYLYTTNGNMKDVKIYHKLEIENLTLLNPLLVLETTEEEKVHEYNTLVLAETGNSFGGIDV